MINILLNPELHQKNVLSGYMKFIVIWLTGRLEKVSVSGNVDLFEEIQQSLVQKARQVKTTLEDTKVTTENWKKISDIQ